MKTCLLLFLIFSLLLSFSSGEQCGRQAGGALCPNALCCSKDGWCGKTEPYCKLPGCQSQCTPGDTPPSPTPPSPTPPGPTPPGPTGQCGHQAGGALCPNDLCCSKDGWCGNTEPYCKLPGCQSQCTPGDTPPSPNPPGPTPPGPTPPGPTPPGPTPPDPTGDLSDIISRTQFYEMFLHMNDSVCLARGFYTYDAFLTAAKSFPGFGTTGDLAARKKEIAAFFGQTSHETTGGWSTAPDGANTWGYCFKDERYPTSNYCDEQSVAWPCAPGKSYHGRGPMMLSWNYNYGQCGRAIGVDLLDNPEFVSNDAVLSFKAAIWFWMTPQFPKPSCHDVITDQWKPSDTDIAAGRLPGYGVITNIINGGLECGHGPDARVADRIDFYQRYCNDIFGVNPGGNLDCYNQRPFNEAVNFFLDAAI